jgi:ATP/maltotriose-dependent transcriptional regulator MalT
MPHAVLETCFLRGLKNYQAAQELGISERQLSRERTRALQLLAEELAPPAPVSVSPDRVPSTDGHLGRDALVRRLAEVATKERLVAVVGRRGTGKTSAVATLARLVRSDLVWWLRIRPGLNDTLETLLLELGRTLSGEGFPALRDYLLSALPRPNLGTATRLALDGLARSPRLLVVDDFDRVLDPAPIEHFLQEGAERVDQLTVITIGKGLVGGSVVEVPALSAGEVADLVEARGVTCPTEVLRALHDVVGGHTGLVAAAAAWWSNRAGARRLFERQVAKRAVLSNLRDVAAFSRARPDDLRPAHGT